MKSFCDLKVWQKAHQLVLEIYKITVQFPDNERFGLISQIRRASTSIPANIAEGSKRKSNKDFNHFLNMAETSLEETKYHLLLSRDLEYIDKESCQRLMDQAEEIGRMLSGLSKRLDS